jgi:hypothetical protein
MKCARVNRRALNFRVEINWLPKTDALITSLSELYLLCRVPDYAE